jgi:type IV secretion system protein VirB3
MSHEQQPDEAQEYMSFNGLGRRPMIFGIPYMTALTLMCVFMLSGVAAGIAFGPIGLLLGVTAVPIGLFIRFICETDDRAIEILVLEVKWAILKAWGGTAKYFGGALVFSPIKYGRKLRDVKQYFEQTTRG